MNEIKKRHFQLFSMAVIFSVLSSISLLASIAVNSEGKNKVMLIGVAILFWIGLILEKTYFWKANKLMKFAITNHKLKIDGNPGVISFAKYTECFIIDSVFIISLIFLIICMMFCLGETFMQYLLICSMVLTFRLHCFLNGRNYKYIKHKER